MVGITSYMYTHSAMVSMVRLKSMLVLSSSMAAATYPPPPPQDSSPDPTPPRCDGGITTDFLCPPPPPLEAPPIEEGAAIELSDMMRSRGTLMDSRWCFSERDRPCRLWAVAPLLPLVSSGFKVRSRSHSCYTYGL